MIETAKRNGLDLEKYLEYLLSNLPNESILTDREKLTAYLPGAKAVQVNCR